MTSQVLSPTSLSAQTEADPAVRFGTSHGRWIVMATALRVWRGFS